MKRQLINRRGFLKKSAVAIALPVFIPSSVLGKNGAVAPSEKITAGAIGIGNRGRHDLSCMLDEADVRFVAVCDVQASCRQQAKEMVDTKYGNKDCAAYRDMFELLGRADIDAVLIATGDRWHALGSILAAKAGKDVYSEKPCGLTMAEAQDLANTMNRYGRVFQAGTQRRSISNFRFAVHLARSGKLGKLHTLHASANIVNLRYDWLPPEPEPPKDVVDWDRWLGPSPWRPYNQSYLKGAWKRYFDFDAGSHLVDWGAHTVDLCQWANNADDTTPVTFEPSGKTIFAHYANGVKLVICYGGLPKSLGTCPVRFEGDQGWVETGDNGNINYYPASLLSERKTFAEKGTSPEQHTRNFFDCVKSRALTAANADVMRHSHIACHAAAIAWQLGRKVTFDPVREEFIGDDEANRMRSRAKRAPWHI